MQTSSAAASPPAPKSASFDRVLPRLRRWLTHREADFCFDPPWWLAVVAVMIVLGTYAFVAWTTNGPLFAADEVGTEGASRLLAKGTTEWTLAGSGYMPGLAVLLAPAWWFTDDPFLVYHVGLAIGVALSVATVWPLSAIARRAGIASVPGSIVLASVVMVFPGRALEANYLLAEPLLTFLTAATIVMAYRVSQQTTVRNSALLGVVAGLAFMAHGRAIALLVATGVWMIMVAGRRWRLVGAFGASGAIVTLGAWLLFGLVTSELYWRDDRLGNTFQDISHASLGAFLAFAAGIAWYAVAAWPAIAVVGALLIAKRIRNRASPERLVAIALIFAAILSYIQLHPERDRPVPRLDVWIYGRYFDHLLVVLAVIGLAVLVRVRHRAVPWLVLGVSSAIGAAFLVLTVPRIIPGGLWVDVHIAGVSHLLSEANFLNQVAEPWLLLTVASVIFGVLFALLGWLRFALPVMAAFALALTLITDTVRVDPRDEPRRVSEEINDPLSVIPGDGPVAFNVDYGLRINFFAFAATPRPIVPATLEDASELYPAVYTGYLDTSPAAFGAKRLAWPQIYYSSVLWVFPGPLFDDLDARGLLADGPAQ